MVTVTLANKDDVPQITAVLGKANIALMEMKQLGTMEEVFLSFRKSKEGLI
jgi:hypothetical protein